VVDDSLAFKTGTGVMYRTINGGNGWQAVFAPDGSTVPEVWMESSTTGFLAHGGLLYRTTNGGGSWSTSRLTQPPSPIAGSNGKGTIALTDDDLGVALETDGVAHSGDRGLTWSVPLNSGLALDHNPRISFANSSFGLIISHSTPLFFVTTDGGNNWVDTENSGGASQDVLAIGDHCWYIPHPADHNYIKYSTNAGQERIEQLTDPFSFEVLGRSRSGRTLWPGTTSGRIYTCLDESPASATEPSPCQRHLICFPNPCDGELGIDRGSFAPSGRSIAYRVFSVDGKLVTRGETSSARLSTKGLPAGLYVLEARDPISGARLPGRLVRR